MLPRPISADPLVLYRTLGLLIDALETALAPVPVTVGTPRLSSIAFRVPTNYFLEVLERLTLTVRAAFEGTARLYLDDDFGTRSRVVLLGKG